MIIFILQLILFTYLISSTFSLMHVKSSEYGNGAADHAKSTAIAIAIITGTSLLLINTVYFLNLINNYRIKIILIFVCLVAAALSLITYAYLEQQRRSPPEYEAKYRELIDASETKNENAQRFSYWTGLVNIVILGLIIAFLVGHTNLTEKDFIRIEKPKLYNVKTSRGRMDYYPGLAERISGNFIV